MPAGSAALAELDKAERARHAAGDGPEHAGAGPGHAFQHLAAAEAALVIIVVVIVVAHRALSMGPLIGYRGRDWGRAVFIPAIPGGLFHLGARVDDDFVSGRRARRIGRIAAIRGDFSQSGDGTQPDRAHFNLNVSLRSLVMSLHLRRAAMAAVSVLALSTTAVMADPPHGGRGGGPPAAAAARPAPAMPRAAPAMPHMSAPPRMAAPAPHMAAPRMAAPPPRMAAPRMATPHIAAPARNMAVPHGGGPRFSAGHAAPHRAVPDVARERAGRSADDLHLVVNATAAT